ncbi:MAG: putative ABC exporter domain-containing protein [Desulfitobacterium sp.]
MLLLRSQLRVSWNKFRYRAKKTILVGLLIALGILAFISSLGYLAYGALESMSYEALQGFLSLLFLGGLVSQIFFGITAAFAALYMSEDLELLFMAPVSLKAVFAVKSLTVIGSNLVAAAFFVFLPGVFYGLFFQAGVAFYVLVVLVTLGLLALGTAIAELLNMLVMRLVPPHRSKEAVGFIGALAGIMIALFFQIPNMLMNQDEKVDMTAWLTGNQELLEVMNYFPWGWGAQSLVAGISGEFLSGLGWSLLILFVGVLLFILAFNLVERGFRRGFISLSQGEGGRRRTKQRKTSSMTVASDSSVAKQSPLKSFLTQDEVSTQKASLLHGAWSVAKKDLLYLKRDSREWFGYLTPLIIMAFFIAQYLFAGTPGSEGSLITIFIMYTIMFSGNMALQSFGREGESDWLLNSVPLGGWPVVWGKLLAAVLPTLVLMEALLVGTAVAINLSTTMILALAIGAIFLSFGSSSIGLFYSINNCRFNPDSPQQRISPGGSLFMYFVNMLFVLLLSIGLLYLFRPDELVVFLQGLPPYTYEGGFWSALLYGLYLLSRPLLWTTWARVLIGAPVTLIVWATVFFGFMAATVQQSRKGFRVEIITSKKKKKK